MQLAVRGRGKWFPQCASDGPVAANALWTNTFCDFDKYILQFGQINLSIWTNTFYNLDQYVLKFQELNF